MIDKRAKTALLLQPPGTPAGNGPTPDQTGQEKVYMDDPARRLLEKMAPYATDFFGAAAQGLDPDDFWKTAWYEIRAADTFPSASISENSRSSDWKTITFRRRDIDYIPTGAKIWFWKSCWLAYNPNNIGGAIPTGVVRRCNRVWKRLFPGKYPWTAQGRCGQGRRQSLPHPLSAAGSLRTRKSPTYGRVCPSLSRWTGTEM